MIHTALTIIIDESTIDAENVSEVAHKLKMCIECEQNKDIIIDLKNLYSLSSSGIGLLIEIKNKLSKTKNNLYCINISEQVKRIFELTKLDTFFIVCNTFEDISFE